MASAKQINAIFGKAIYSGAPLKAAASRVKARKDLIDAQVGALKCAVDAIRCQARETPAWANGYNSAITAIELQILALTGDLK